MHSKRKHLGVAVLDNMIYAVGGRDELSELNSVEKYVTSSSPAQQALWKFKKPVILVMIILVNLVGPVCLQ